MAKQSLIISDFSGSLAKFEKKDLPFSARFIKGLNIFEDPSYMVPFAKPTKVSGTVIEALPKWMVDASSWSTDRYVYDEAGNIYKETSGGTWTKDRATATIGNGAAGQGLLVFNDYLYYSTSTTLGRLGLLSGTPTYNDDFISDGTLNLDQSLDTSGQVYTLATSINEGATHRQTFTPTNDPLKRIQILIGAKGTGDWTVTVHDKANKSIGAKTLTNVNVTGSVDNNFDFTTPLRVTLDNSYHFHVTSTVADGTVTTTTASDLETVDFHTFFGILVADTDFHPIVDFDDGQVSIVVIGNERYLAVWDEETYEPNKIIFPPGFKTWSLTKNQEFIVADCFKGDSIDTAEEVRRFYWDGIAPTLNFSRPIDMGAVGAAHYSKGRLISVNGTQGEVYIGDEEPKLIAKVPKLARGKKVEVLSGGITDWLGLTIIAFGANTDDSTGLEQGLYAWGNKDGNLPEVLAYMGPISTGTVTATTLEIGMVKGFGKDLVFGWRDGATYGVDKIIRTDNPVTAGGWESLIFDGGNPKKDKLALRVVITFVALASGETVTPKYKLDRGSYVLGNAVTTVGETSAEVMINTRFKDIEFGFNFTTSTTFLKITGIAFYFDSLESEERD